jgi:hypothetical protein
VINDIDFNQFLFGRATCNGDIRMFRLTNLNEKPFFLTCGSKTMKSYLPHPTKEGVSMIKVTQNKVVAVLGNLIRVYSFDLDTKELKK